MSNQNLKVWEVVNKLRKGEVNAHVAHISAEIDDLQKKFEGPDYKTTKNLQYEKMGLDVPYPWEEVYQEAEEIRVQIREKEQEIENLLDLTRPVKDSSEENVAEDASENVTE